MSSGATQLATPVADGGIASVNFFNGRLLTGEDLSREQAANRESRLRLGQAIGTGIAYGLEVAEALGTSTPDRPVLQIQPGLAVNPQGAALKLVDRTDVLLIADAPAGAPAPGGLFTDCANGGTGGYAAGFGAYLLTIGPSETGQGRAATSGLANADAPCNTNVFVEGVTFRLVEVPIAAGEVATPALLRNHLAARAFGVGADARTAFLQNPFGPSPTSYGLIDELSQGCLTDAEVPLALLAWTAAAGIEFVDLWSVRRRLVAPAADRRWPLLLGDREQAEAEAMFLEFEEYSLELLDSLSAPQALAAADRFEFLPPVGLLPVLGLGSNHGVNALVFFGDQASSRVELTDAQILRSLLCDGLQHEPIVVGGKERIQLYLLWENLSAFRQGLTTQLSLVFAKDTIRYRGIARFGDAYWDLSRFAQTVL